MLHVAGRGKEVHGDLERQVQGRVDALVAERGQARLQQADGRRGEALQPSDVVGKHGVNFAAGDDGADEGGGPTPLKRVGRRSLCLNTLSRSSIFFFDQRF